MRNIKSVAVTGALVLGLVVGCGPDASAPKQQAVWGRFDEVKHKEKVTKKVKEQKYKRVCARTEKGKCKSYRRVKDGFRTYTKTVSDEAWCVELDDVNGATKNKDVWYAVTHATYIHAATLYEGDITKFTPIHGGCW